MAQHDYVIANQSGAAFRSDLNNGLSAIVSQNSGSAAPSTTYAYMWWADTTTGLLKIRNAANSAWVTVGTLATTNLGLAPLASPTFTGTVTAPTFTASTGVNIPLGSAGTPSLYFTGDPNTGIYSPSADWVAITTGGTGRLFVDASGRLGLGSSAPVVDLDVAPAASTATFRIHARSNTTPVASIELVRGTSTTFGADGSGDYRIKNESGNLSFEYGDSGVTTERARLTSDGKFLVGTSTASKNLRGEMSTAIVGTGDNTSAGLAVTGYCGTPAAAYPLIDIQRSRGTTDGSMTVVASGDKLGVFSFRGADGTNFISGASIGGEVDGTPGANDMPGRLVFSTTADGASSPTERVRITNGGLLLVGKQAESLSTPGFSAGTGGIVCARNDLPVLYVSRIVDDGTLVSFCQGGTEEGTISVSGTTVSYNGAHLSRWSQLPGGATREEILRGTVLSNIDEMCGWGKEENEQLNRMKVSDVEGDKNVSGVFQAWDDDDDTYTDDFYCAMTGDFIIRIAEGVTVERGDLLMSAGDGTAKPQDDDIIRSKTVAKVTSTNVSCTYDDGSYCVPCVLMAC